MSISDKKWTPGCQGIAFHDGNLFVSQNRAGGGTNRAKKGVYKLDWDFKIQKSLAKKSGVFGDRDFEYYGGEHWGDLDVHEGTIYVALEADIAKFGLLGSVTKHRVLEIDAASFDVRASKPLKPHESAETDEADGGAALSPSGRDYPHDGGGFPWCAINPWNGYLYTSNFGGVRTVYAYDPANGYRRVPEATIHLDPPNGESLIGVQGGGFSNNGHLYLSSYTDKSTDTYSFGMDKNDADVLFAFNSLNGASMGWRNIRYGDHDKEIEGLTVVPPGSLYLVLLNRVAGVNNADIRQYVPPRSALEHFGLDEFTPGGEVTDDT